LPDNFAHTCPYLTLPPLDAAEYKHPPDAAALDNTRWTLDINPNLKIKLDINTQ
jgi:hypothetical protein